MCSHRHKDDCFIKKIKKIIRYIGAGILLIYICLIVLVNIPAIQQQLGSWIAGALSDKIGTHVTVGRVNIGMFNRLIIDDISIDDQAGKQMLAANRTAVNINLYQLLKGKVEVSSAQFFGLFANIYKATPESTPNYQFLLDAFKSDEESETPLDLSITTLILRRGHISYNIHSEPLHKGEFDASHIDLLDIDFTISLNKLTDTQLEANIRRLNATETNSHLQLKNLTTKISANNRHAIITDFNMKMPLSSIYFSKLEADYPNYDNDQSYSFSTKIDDSFITPSDLAPLLPQLRELTTPLYLSCAIEGNQNTLNINDLRLHTDNNSTHLSLDATQALVRGKTSMRADIHNLFFSSEDADDWLNAFAPEVRSSLISNIGDFAYNGTFSVEDNDIYADGILQTDVGSVTFEGSYSNNKTIGGNFSTDGIDIAKLTGNTTFGKMAFDIAANLQLTNSLPNGTIEGNVAEAELMGKSYSDIAIDIQSHDGTLDGSIHSSDPSLAFMANGTYDTRSTGIDLTLHVDTASVPLNNNQLPLADVDMKLNGRLNGEKSIDITTNGLTANIQGNLSIDKISNAIQNQLAANLPTLIPAAAETTDNYAFDITVSKSPFTSRFIPDDIDLVTPVTITGKVDDSADTLSIHISTPEVVSGSRTLEDVNAQIEGNNSNLSLTFGTNLQLEGDDDTPATSTGLHLTADAHSDKITSLLSWQNEGTIYATTHFTDSLGHINTNIDLHTSQFTINDTTWTIHPATASIYDGKVNIHNMHISSSMSEVEENSQTNHSLTIDGIVSDSPSDSLIVKLQNIEIAYITDIVDFDAVDFKGLVSGTVKVASALNDEPHLSATILVSNMHLQGGRLGTATIQALWNKERNGIDLLGHIIDDYKGKNRLTEVSGYVAPATNQMDIRVDTHNTCADFLNGFLSSTFSDISGDCNGTLHIIGPLSDVNLVGDISADVGLRLRATDVMYHVNPNDTLRLRPYQFMFEDIRLADDRGTGLAVVNGTLGHHNMKNFTYDFDIDFKNMTAYDVHEFNSDKFLATVFVDGGMTLHGSDGHPLVMAADITPCKGSVFAYDAATPDAISSSNFVEIHEKPAATELGRYSFGSSDSSSDIQPAKADDDYTNDITFDININVTPDCEIKLRMDNVEDGYMTTHGSGKLLARYHNKSPFTLIGNYNIDGGRYRMHLQDPIVRDLEIQPQSKVEFNGNPFDANIRLLCHYTLNAVPLSDLTGSAAYNQNSKVKVICVLDITGNLNNMEFGFDLQMPNVNDETRQLVRSLISSDEEMNMQMIYLLGLGRFYTNEYARASGETVTTNGAVNTLLSSTISGQVNQMLSDIIGTDSKWNLGTGLSTGQNGWEDLDVEGILSGRLLNDRLLINGSFGYRDNALTNQTNFIGDFDVRWRLTPTGNTYIKAYNQTNDRYFTKATLNTQGIGISHHRDFDSWRQLFRKKMKEENDKVQSK